MEGSDAEVGSHRLVIDLNPVNRSVAADCEQQHQSRQKAYYTPVTKRNHLIEGSRDLDGSVLVRHHGCLVPARGPRGHLRPEKFGDLNAMIGHNTLESSAHRAPPCMPHLISDRGNSAPFGG